MISNRKGQGVAAITAVESSNQSQICRYSKSQLDDLVKDDPARSGAYRLMLSNHIAAAVLATLQTMFVSIFWLTRNKTTSSLSIEPVVDHDNNLIGESGMICVCEAS